MSNISKLYRDDDDRFNEFVARGAERIRSNREFCGLTISDFVDYVVDGDMSGKMLNGLVRSIINMELSPEVTQLEELEARQKTFRELLDRFMTKNEKHFHQEFTRLQLEAKAEAETAHILLNNVSNF